MSENWRSRAVSPADVVAVVGNGATLFLHGACATPLPLVEALCARRDLEGVRLYHLHTAGPAPFAEPGREREFRSVSLFTGAPIYLTMALAGAGFAGSGAEVKLSALGKSFLFPLFFSPVVAVVLGEEIYLQSWRNANRLVGTAAAFGRVVQDLLQPRSVLLGERGRTLLDTQQQTRAGTAVPMTLGWHVGEHHGTRVLFKEGGGGGFHCLMRIYPSRGLGSVVMTNATRFDVHGCLNTVDPMLPAWTACGRTQG